jgi:hypothetical protein
MKTKNAPLAPTKLSGILAKGEPKNKNGGTDYLAMWTYDEAVNIANGYSMTGAVGKHADGLKRGDRLFIQASHENELYLLGAIEVRRPGVREATGKSIFGPFQILPMKGLKWRLRFDSKNDRLKQRSTDIFWQVRSRRKLAGDSARMLSDLLGAGSKLAAQIS